MNQLALFFLALKLLSSTVSAAQSDTASSQTAKPVKNEICEFENYGVTATVKPSSLPNYFFRTFTYEGKKYISYAGYKKLFFLDLNSGKEYAFDGEYDPVPLANGVISTPLKKIATGPVTFRPSQDIPTVPTISLFLMDDILANNQTPQQIVVEGDRQFTGTYQSVGTLKESNGQTLSRMITDNDGEATAAEYLTVIADGKRKVSMTKTPQRLCSNVQFKLPMISKDGSKISGYDIHSKTSKIWAINSETGKCDEIVDLKMIVGKADFSYDGKQITFHTSVTQEPGAYFENPLGSDRNMNVFVYDFEKQSLRKMSQNAKRDHSYLPIFSEDGSIIYSQLSEDGRSQFVQADPKLVKSIFYDPMENLRKDQLKQYSLGQLWSLACLDRVQDSHSISASTALSLDPTQCNSLVDKFWDQFRIQIAETNSEKNLAINDQTGADLKAACPTDKTMGQNFQLDKGAKHLSMSPAESILSAKCSLCHGTLSYSELRSKKIDKSLGNEILKRIKSNGPDKMPKSGELNQEEIKILDRYLQSL